MANEYPDGGLSSVIIGEETSGTGSPITDRTEMYQRAFAFNTWSVNETEEPEENTSIRASRSPAVPEDGRLGVEGSGEFPITLEDMLPWWRGLLGGTPVSTAVPDKTLAPTSTDITDVLATAFFDSATTTDTTITTVDDGDLSTNAALTIDDDLSNYDDALTLTVTPANTPTLTNTATDATIIIAYEDADGNPGSNTLTFSDAEKANAQTMTLPANSRITSVTPTGWSAGDVDITTTVAANIIRQPNPNRSARLEFVLSAANDDGKIIVTGKRRVGLGSTDTLPQKETINTDSGTMFTTSKYFYQISKIEIEDSSGAALSSGTVEITAKTENFETEIPLSDTIFPGWTVESERAKIPTVVKTLRPVSGTINVGSPNSLALTFIGEREDQYRTIEGDEDVEQFESTRSQHSDEFPLVTRRFFPSWGGYIEIDGEVLIFDSATVNVDQGVGFSAGITGSRFQTDVESLTRSITASLGTFLQSGTVSSDTFTRWQEKFREGDLFDVRIVIYHWPGIGRQYETRLILPNVRVSAPVPLDISDRGRVSRTIEVQAYTSEDVDTPDDIKIIVVSPDEWT